MALNSVMLENMLTEDQFSPSFLFNKFEDDVVLFRDIEEWNAVVSLLTDKNQVSIKVKGFREGLKEKIIENSTRVTAYFPLKKQNKTKNMDFKH